MNIDEIREWKRKQLKGGEGRWKRYAILLIINRLDPCEPVMWLNTMDSDPWGARERARCYEELVRMAGGILNDAPNVEHARQLLFNIRSDFSAFRMKYRDIPKEELRVMHQDFDVIASRCLCLADDSFNRMSKISALGGF